MRVVVLVNAAAGSVRGEREGVAERIVDAFAGAGAVAEVVMEDPARLGQRIRAVWSAADRPDVVVVAGGDGSIGSAAGDAADVGAVMGVLPLGTFNHFAKDLGMPTDLPAAAAAVVEGVVRSVDVAEVNGRTFVNNSVLGLYPELVAVRDHIREARGWGKIRAVPVAAVDVLRRFRIHRVGLAGPGYARPRVRTPLVFVGNGVFDAQPGRGVARADLTDGVLGVAVAQSVSRWGLVRSGVHTLVRGAKDAPDVETAELASLTVTARARHLRVAVDGEVAWMATPLRYRVRPGALSVVGPPPD